MARVEWTRLAPDDVEEVLAVLLCRERTTAIRIRPSRGDGGIDILVPGQGGCEVYQVKSFTQTLTAKQKKQIQHSLARLAKFALQNGLAVTSWHLTLPLDPTNENLKWLAGVAQNIAGVVDWRGLNFCDALAAKYPDVIDYYLRDGKERLQTALTQFAVATRIIEPGACLQPASMSESLAALSAVLNKCDPHYSYEVTVGEQQPDISSPRPNQVCTLQQQIESSYVTWQIYARFADAVNVRPLKFHGRITAEAGSQLAEDLAQFHLYGAPFTAPPGTVTGTADLPGGFGGAWEGGGLIVSEAADTARRRLRVQILNPANEVLQSLRLNAAATQGPSGRGSRLHAVDDHGILQLELRQEAGNHELDFGCKMDLRAIEGKHPEEVLPALRFLDALHPPNRIRLGLPYGPAREPAAELSIDDPPSVALVLRLIEALARIQDHTNVEILVPAMESVTEGMAAKWLYIDRLLRGETVSGGWDQVEIVGSRTTFDQVAESNGAAFWLVRPLAAVVGDSEVVLGYEEVVLESARLQLNEPETTDGGDTRFRLVPGTSPTASSRFLDAPPQPA